MFYELCQHMFYRAQHLVVEPIPYPFILKKAIRLPPRMTQEPNTLFYLENVSAIIFHVKEGH